VPVGTILDLLQKVQLIDDRAHDAVMSRTRSRSGGHIVQQVAELGLATESSIARALSVELGLPRDCLPDPLAGHLRKWCAAHPRLAAAVRQPVGVGA